MRVLYCNPIALDYRIPFYRKLNELFEGNFYFLYSANRYRLTGRVELMNRLTDTLKENAIAYEGEKIFNTYTRSFTKYSSEKGQRIPITWGLFHKIKAQHPDVLITEGFFQWTPLVLLYSILFRKPIFIGYERTPWTERNNGKLKTWHRKLTDKFVTGYLVNGSETKKYLMSIGVKEDKIHIGGMSADGEGLKTDIMEFKKSNQYQAYHKKYHNGNGLMYLFSGQVVERKGVKYLLPAWMEHINSYPNDMLIVVGGGDQYNELRNRYSGEPSIMMEGRVNYLDIHKYYAVADVFILPTIEDNWSLVIPEAMSCGLPVSTSIYNGCHPELVKKDVNGITFDPFKQESILEALDYFHHVDLKALGLNSIELEKEFNTENSARREYEGIMKGLLRK